MMAAAFRGLNAPLSTPELIVLGVMLCGLAMVGAMAVFVAYDMWRESAARKDGDPK